MLFIIYSFSAKTIFHIQTNLCRKFMNLQDRDQCALLLFSSWKTVSNKSDTNMMPMEGTANLTKHFALMRYYYKLLRKFIFSVAFISSFAAIHFQKFYYSVNFITDKIVTIEADFTRKQT